MPKFTCERAKEIYTLVRNSTSEEYLKNWRQWFDEILSPFDDLSNETVKIPPSTKASCLILNEFLRVSVQFPAISKEISTEKIGLLIPKLTNVSPDNHILSALKSCLIFYPTICGRFASKNIYSYLNKIVNSSSSSSTRTLAAECFSLMPFVGPAGEKHSKHLENFTKQLNFLLFTITGHLELLTGTNVKEKQINNAAFSAETLLQLDDSLTTENLQFCLSSVNFLISRSTLFVVPLPLAGFVGLLRCFTFAFTSQRSLSIEAVATFLDLFSKIPSLVRFSFTPFCSEIFDLLESVLHQTTKNANYSTLRCCVYKVLKEIAVGLGAASKLHLCLGKFWSYCKSDLQADLIVSKDASQAHTAPSNVTPTPLRKRQKISHRKTQQQKIDDVDQFIEKHSDLLLSDSRKRVISCAEMLTEIFQRVGVVVKQELYRNAQQTTCELILKMPRKINAEGNCGVVYNDSHPRLVVYSLLRTLVLCQHPTCPPAVQCALQIFNQGLLDTDSRVSNFCTGALYILNNVTKPRVPCLEAVSVQEQTERQPVEIEEDQNDVLHTNIDTTDREAREIIFNSDQVNKNAFDDEDEEKIIVNIGSESSDDGNDSAGNQEDIQIVLQKKPTPPNVRIAPQQLPKAKEPFAGPTRTKMNNNNNNYHDQTVIQMIADFVDEPVDQ